MWKRRNLTPEENSKNVEFSEELGLRHAILREPSVVDEFYHEKVFPSDDNQEAVCLVDPIHILFNQQRLESIGATAAKSFLDSLTPKSNDLSELRAKCSDEDLMTMVKSRHLQSPAEILSWCRYMNQNVEKFNAEVKKLVEQQTKIAEQQTKKAEQQTVVTEKTE